MTSRFVFFERLQAAGFIRPGVLYQGLQLSPTTLSRSPVSLPIALSGLAVELLAWLQSALYSRAIAQRHAYLHELLAFDTTIATARNALIVATQVVVLLKPCLQR